MTSGRIRNILLASSRAYVFLASVGLSTAILLALLDALVGGGHESFSESIRTVPYYADKPWTKQFIRDQDRIGSARVRYAPFTVWKRPPFRSETVNVDADGLRVVPETDCGEGSLKIWFFGGSTMWGTNSPDWGTIPSQFQALAAKDLGVPLCVRNFGESAWVSTQSVIALIQQLQRGNVPDYVVFYHGINDLLWAFGNSQPFGHAEYKKIASKFNRSGRGRGSRETVRRDPADLLAFVTPAFKARWDKARTAAQWPQDDSPEGLARLARATVDVSLVNHRIVLALAEEHGFKAHFFWQPYLIYDRKPTAPLEEAMLRRSGRWAETFRIFATAANERVAATVGPDFTDLSGCFQDFEGQLYTDIAHVTPEANALIASDILKVLRPSLIVRPRRTESP
ncbi:MAG: SGNH/GDSL hydrolase family protein [Steroidobacteraceae bacterium]